MGKQYTSTTQTQSKLTGKANLITMLMMFQPQSSPFPIDAIVNEVMNQVVLNNCYQKDGSDTTTTATSDKKKCHRHSKHPCGGGSSSDGKNNDTDTDNENKANGKKKASCYNIVYEKKPMHHEDTAEYAKVSFDVAGFTDEDINVHVDEDRIVTIQGERTNALGDVFKIDRKFRLDKRTADVDNIDAKIVVDETEGSSILEVIVKKKNKVGPRVIKISTTTTTATNAQSNDDDDSLFAGSDEKKATQHKDENETVNDDDNTKKGNSDDQDNKAEEKEEIKSDDDLEFEQI